MEMRDDEEEEEVRMYNMRNFAKLALKFPFNIHCLYDPLIRCWGNVALPYNTANNFDPFSSI